MSSLNTFPALQEFLAEYKPKDIAKVIRFFLPKRNNHVHTKITQWLYPSQIPCGLCAMLLAFQHLACE